MKRVWSIAAAVALSFLFAHPAATQEADSAASVPKTAKERQAGKAYDPQRVNDCKVPAELRGDKPRSADCGEKAKAASGVSEGAPAEGSHK